MKPVPTVPVHPPATSIHPPASRARLVALDAARGLAVIGMFIQHFASTGISGGIVAGNTTLLFVLCGGMSYSIMAQRALRGTEPPSTFHSRMLARSVFIDVLGYTLILLNAPVGVILPAYAGLFVLALVLIRRSTRTLFVTAGVLLILAPPIMLAGMSYLTGAPVLGDLAGGPMSAIALAPAFVAGMALARLDLHRLRTLVTTMALGAAMMLLGMLCGSTFLPGISRDVETWQVATFGTGPEPDRFAIWPMNTVSPNIGQLFWTAPHSASFFQTLTGLGLALLAFGLLGVIAHRAARLLEPLATAGRVPLTLYSLQFIVMWALGLFGIELQLGSVPFAELIVAAVTIGLAYLISLGGQGPLERAMRSFDGYFSPSPARPRTIRAD